MAKVLIGNVKGPQGAQGATGPRGPQGNPGATGPGVASGGSAGQALMKKSGVDYDTEWGNVAKSVNGIQADESGNIPVDIVDFAKDIATDDNQQSNGTYVRRTTGGNASLSDGKAWLRKLEGHMTRTGYTAQSVAMTVTKQSGSELEASIDEDDFIAAASSTSGTQTFTYGESAWDTDPSTYGITVTGTPVTGDVISVVYQKEVRGTITVASPTSFVSTGWNLYDHTAGYARVVKYSNSYGFLIGGTYTKLEYSATQTGTKTEITPDDGYFTIPGDGFLFVTGGNSTDTYILMTWSDWMEGYEGSWKAYTESTISLSSVMSSFTAGLCRVENVYDEIDIAMQKAVSRIQRKSYTASNLASAKASGLPYIYDENYIYVVRSTPVTYDITLDGEFTANDHGMEYFAGTTEGVYAETLYGKNLVDYLRTDIPNALSADAASLTALGGGMAIISVGDTHVAITSGEYVYVKGHSTLAEGLYTASSNISANGTLSSSNLTAVSKGGLNALNDQIAKYHEKDVSGQSNNTGAISTGIASTKYIVGYNVKSGTLEVQGFTAYSGTWYFQTTVNTSVNISVLYRD